MSKQMSPEELHSLLMGPAMRPPDGIEPNFDNPSSPAAVAAGWFDSMATLVIVTVATAMRLYTKMRIIRHFDLEDYMIVAAFISFVIFYWPLFEAFRLGALVHQWDFRLEAARDYFYYAHLTQTIYVPVILFIKIAILLQYIRVFVPKGVRNAFFWLAHLSLWLNMVFYVYIMFILIFICDPIAKSWDPLIMGGSCMDAVTILLASSIFNLVSDAIILILPQMTIWKLQMPRSRKISVSILFTGGLFACICAALKIHATVRLQQTGDFTYYSNVIGYWSCPELLIGFLAVCVPVAPKFIKETFGARTRSRLGSSSSSSQGTKPRSVRGWTWKWGGAGYVKTYEKGDVPSDVLETSTQQPEESRKLPITTHDITRTVEISRHLTMTPDPQSVVAEERQLQHPWERWT